MKPEMRLLAILIGLAVAFFSCEGGEGANPLAPGPVPVVPAGPEKPGPHSASPVARPSCAAPDLLYTGDSIKCHGWRSTDNIDDDMIVSYRWRVRSAPLNSEADFLPADRSETDLTFDLPGTYTVELVVQDTSLMSAPATLAYEVRPRRAYISFTVATVGGESYYNTRSWLLVSDLLRNDAIDLASVPQPDSFEPSYGDSVYFYNFGVSVGRMAYSPRHELIFAASPYTNDPTDGAPKGISVIDVSDRGRNQPVGFEIEYEPVDDDNVQVFIDKFKLFALSTDRIPYDLLVIGNELYVTYYNRDEVVVFDLGEDGLAFEETARLPTCPGPRQMATAGGNLYLACRNGSGNGLLQVIDLATWRELARIDLVGLGTEDVVVGGDKLYVSHLTSHSISALRLRDLKIIKTIPLIFGPSKNSPFELIYADDVLYASNYNGSEGVNVIRISDLTNLGFVYSGLSMGGRTFCLASDGFDRLYAGNNIYNYVTLIGISDLSHFKSPGIIDAPYGNRIEINSNKDLKRFKAIKSAACGASIGCEFKPTGVLLR